MECGFSDTVPSDVMSSRSFTLILSLFPLFCSCLACSPLSFACSLLSFVPSLSKCVLYLPSLSSLSLSLYLSISLSLSFFLSLSFSLSLSLSFSLFFFLLCSVLTAFCLGNLCKLLLSLVSVQLHSTTCSRILKSAD